MRGRQFLDLSRDNLSGNTEVHWRGSAGRTYYALFLECRDTLVRWGFTIPPRDNVHTFVRLRFTFAADPDLKTIGFSLDRLGQLRNRADYDLSHLTQFTSVTAAKNALLEAEQCIALLDTLDGDLARRAAAKAAIKKAFP